MSVVKEPQYKKQKQESEEKRRKAVQNADNQKMIAALESATSHYIAVNHKRQSEKRYERAREERARRTEWKKFILDRLALFVAAAAAAAAIYAVIDSHRDNVATRAISKDTEERQLRAYVNYKNSQIDWVTPTAFRVTFTFKNWGQTPSYKTETEIRAGIVEVDFDDKDPIEDDLGQPDNIAPSAEFIVQAHLHEITEDQIRALRSGTYVIYVKAVVRYIDAFGVPHVTVIRSRSKETEPAKIWHLWTTKEGSSSD